MHEIEFHPEARDDYREALAWYGARNPTAADRFEQEVERVLKLASSNPRSFPAYDEVHRFALLHRYPYSLIYEVQADRIIIMAVAHSRRSADYWRDRS